VNSRREGLCRLLRWREREQFSVASAFAFCKKRRCLVSKNDGHEEEEEFICSSLTNRTKRVQMS
jgi:hypothetical protein